MIELNSFDEQDFNQLIDAIPDARFLLQWAGPQYVFPLTASQLNETLAKATGEQPLYRVFKALKADTKETIGHVQLMNIDRRAACCVLGRVIIFDDFRGKGLGQEIVKLAVEEAFEILNLREVTLNVFDFNLPAIQTYKNLGFEERQLQKGARNFQNESWNLVNMALTRDKWLHSIKC